ncbi:MAG: ribonuclease HII [Thermoanaerobacteraceae bacterium]|nr:ribonuclease HII [Thermoanaerobacteraceae bacterium]
MELKKEQYRLQKLYDFERKLKQRGYTLVAGVDEAGRGPLAGPVVAAAVILALDTQIIDLKDSKKISEKKREKVYEDIKSSAISLSYDVVDVQYIDNYNILNATMTAMKNAVNKLSVKPEYILVDALKIPDMDIPQEAIVHGDSICACIAAASVVAKVERDRIMREYDLIYPEYQFIKNKGYGTKEHINSIKKYGFSPIHRKSFSIKGLNM